MAHKVDIQLQILQPVGFFNVLACVLCLFVQGIQAQRDFINQIIHAYKVVSGFLQTALRFFLTDAEGNDACRFFKNLAPLLPLSREDVINPSLSNDGIAFSANPRIPEQFENVPQAASAFI